MRISILICTYKRADHLRVLLQCLARQSYREFEVLVLDGSGDDKTVRNAIDEFRDSFPQPSRLRVIGHESGLTPRRNLGLRNAEGDLLCFLDDDVVLGDGFLQLVVTLFSQPGMDDVGGVCGYDILHYGVPISWRWKLRRLLGAVHSLEPGSVDHLGRNVPISFAQPFTGCRPIGWFNGFCMIFRKQAVANESFDEKLPSYGGDDRDLSMRVGRKWRLLFCGDLRLEHRSAPANRTTGARRVYESAYGTGRGFAKNACGIRDHLIILQYIVVELIVDLAALLRRPSLLLLRSALARPRGVVAGYLSYGTEASCKA
jgi:glycosyltransferase involved in cell wall biosynthesis